MRAGAPMDRDRQDDRQTKKLADEKAQAKKPGEKGAASRLSSRLPPPAETFKQNELLLAKPSEKVLEEMRERRYTVQRKGGLTHVVLPTGAAAAWQVQRELTEKFPEAGFGLNFIYKPYRSATQPGLKSGPTPTPSIRTKGCPDERCYGPRLIAWNEELATCAAGLTVGMIDTAGGHEPSRFRRESLKSIDLATSRTPGAARHWHGPACCP